MSRLRVLYTETKHGHYGMIYPKHPDVESGIAMFTKTSKTLKGAEARVKRIVEGLGL